MKFAIISNKSKDSDGRYLRKVIAETEKYGGEVCYAGLFGIDSDLAEAWDRKPDMILAMGGDGTFLNIAGRTAKAGIPILGINIGSMGFLSGTEAGETDNILCEVMAGNYSISPRMMIQAKIERKGNTLESIHALNDIVISRGLLSRIVNIGTYVDKSYIDTFPGDGIIIATPTGSTGYSLSAGGPVIAHGLDLMLITPICPHIMHARPFVTGADSEITLTVNEAGDYRCTLTSDGQKGFELMGGDRVTVTRGPYEINMVYIGDNDLYATLRRKIYYRNGEKNEA